MREGRCEYDKRNISVVICNKDILVLVAVSQVMVATRPTERGFGRSGALGHMSYN
jgi:hypothetical protein